MAGLKSVRVWTHGKHKKVREEEERTKKEKEVVKAQKQKWKEVNENDKAGREILQRKQAGKKWRWRQERHSKKGLLGRGQSRGRLALLGCFMLTGHKSCVCAHVHMTHACRGPRC